MKIRISKSVWVDIAQHHRLVAYRQKFISHGFGGQISKGTVLAGSVSSAAALCGCVPTWPYCCGCISVVSSYKDISPTGSGPNLRPHLTLITSLKAPSPHILILGIRASTYDCWRGHILANNDWLWIQTPSSNNTREDYTHGHHQMVDTEIRLIIFFAAKDGEALYSQQKQDGELTVAQIINSLLSNSD